MSKRISCSDSDDSGINVTENRNEIQGYLSWAQIRGFSYWPAITTVDPFEGLTFRRKQKKGKEIHVHFLAYHNLRAWVSESKSFPFEGRMSYMRIAESYPKRRKDFEPGKKLRARFEKAIEEAEKMIGVHIDDRCASLGLLYVLIERPLERRNSNISFKSIEDGKRKSKSDEKKKSNNDEKRKSNNDEEINNEKLSVELGTLLWGQMTGFPYWPCFVTPSPVGTFKGSESRNEIHVQFFNWNDECGWVSKTLPWCSLTEYSNKSKSLDQKSLSEWRAVGKMHHKWKTAYLQAKRTESLSKEERLAKYYVHYNESLSGISKIPRIPSCKYHEPRRTLMSSKEEIEIMQRSENSLFSFSSSSVNSINLHQGLQSINNKICYIRLVRLPSLFLSHNSVLLQEMENEIIITDIDSGEFLAKKIMYN